MTKRFLTGAAVASLALFIAFHAIGQYLAVAENRQRVHRSLKDADGRRLKLGVGVSHLVLRDPHDAALIRRHCQIPTPENCMKPQNIHPAEDGWNFKAAELDIDVVTRSRWLADGGQHCDELARCDAYKDGLPREIEQKQIEQYVPLFKLFDKNSDIVERVAFWNLHDGQSWLNYFPWRRVNHPLLFDRDRKPKRAIDAVYAAHQAK